MERNDPSLMHEEIVMVRIEDIMEAENGFSIAFLPKHRTTLNLVDLGEISAYLGIGLRWEDLETRVFHTRSLPQCTEGWKRSSNFD
jgi:hypothetical protein